MTLRIALYARYSSDAQRAASIEDQLRLCRQRADREGWPIVATYTDAAISGATTQRPGYQALLRRLTQGGLNVVLAESLDRFSRDQEHIAAFYKAAVFADVRVVTLAEGDISELHIGLKGTMSALYLKDLADKTRRGEAGRILKGRSIAGPAYGYRMVRRLGPDGEPERGLREIDQDEAVIVQRIFRDYAAGASPLAIARALNAESIPGPTGRLWYDASIRGRPKRGEGLLRNGLYAGRLVWNRMRSLLDPQTGQTVRRPNAAEAFIEVEVAHLRIVDQPLWDTVQQRLAAEAVKPTEQQVAADGAMTPQGFWDRRRPRHLLTNKVFCGCCGGSFTARGKDYLACHNAFQGSCDNRRSLRRGQLEGRVLASLRRDLMAPEAVEGFIEAFNAEWKRLEREANVGTEAARRELTTAERKLQNLVGAIADGLRHASVRQQLDQLEARCTELQAQIGAPAPARPVFPPNIAALYRQRVADLERAVADKKSPAVLEAARALIERVVVHAPAEPGDRHPVELEGSLPSMLRVAGMATPASPVSQASRGHPSADLDLFAWSVKKAQGANPHACLLLSRCFRWLVSARNDGF